MDILDLLANKEFIQPIFLPIFSADDQQIIGYEVQGRYKTNQVWDIQSFIQDQVPEEYIEEIELEYMNKMIPFISEESNDKLYFVFCNPNRLKSINLDDFIEYLLSFSNYGVSLKQWVLIIQEYEFSGPNGDLYRMIKYLKSCGVKIAVNGIGKEDSHLNRIGGMNPDIIIVSLNKLQQTSVNVSYHHVLQAITVLARKTGATILFENIMTEYQLHYAWKNNGRYFHGPFLSDETMSPVQNDCKKEFLKNEMQRYIRLEKKRLAKIEEFTDKLNNKMNENLAKIRKIESYDKTLEYLSALFMKKAFRVYICDEDGFQISSNFTMREDSKWIFEKEYINKNWSWRPYFLATIQKLQIEQKGNLSELYHDLETGQNIRTFAYPISESSYVFIDITYNYLYAEDLLQL